MTLQHECCASATHTLTPFHCMTREQPAKVAERVCGSQLVLQSKTLWINTAGSRQTQSLVSRCVVEVGELKSEHYLKIIEVQVCMYVCMCAHVFISLESSSWSCSVRALVGLLVQSASRVFTICFNMCRCICLCLTAPKSQYKNIVVHFRAAWLSASLCGQLAPAHMHTLISL